MVAGEAVEAGEQVHIVYGTEATSNAELLCHYGFIDGGAAAADRRLVAAQPESTVAALEATSLQEDQALLAEAMDLPYQQKLALGFRISLKKARDAVARGAPH